MISYCGLNCNTCPIDLAARETDKERQLKMRKSTAEECAILKRHFTPDADAEKRIENIREKSYNYSRIIKRHLQ